MSKDYEALLYSAQRVREAAEDGRSWLLDCVGDPDERAYIRLMNHISLVQVIEAQYEGGYLQFLADSINLKEERA